MNEIKEQIVVFGGVFDPVHNGHISAALAALEQTGAAKVVFMPERVPYRKQNCTPYDHRLEMLRLATAEYPELEVVDFPGDRQTIAEAFSWLAQLYPGVEFIWLIGSDVLKLLGGWRNVQDLSQLGVAELMIAQRSHDSEESSPQAISLGVDIRKCTAPNNSISSSQVRSDVQFYKDQLPQAVYDYILQQNLYSH